MTGSILLIEDDVGFLDFLEKFFKRQNLEVFTATNGEEGLTLLSEKKPSVVLLDMKLGVGMTGMEVLRLAKQLKLNIPIVVVTAIENENVAELAKGLGAAGYLTKPFQSKDLEEVVLSHLNRKSL